MMNVKNVSKVVILMIVLFTIRIEANAQIFQWTNNFGKVARLYPSQDKVFFSLRDGKTSMNPKQGYYYISMEHKNYDAMVKLLYMAAENGWIIYARTDEELDSNGFAKVVYLVVDL